MTTTMNTTKTFGVLEFSTGSSTETAMLDTYQSQLAIAMQEEFRDLFEYTVSNLSNIENYFIVIEEGYIKLFKKP